MVLGSLGGGVGDGGRGGGRGGEGGSCSGYQLPVEWLASFPAASYSTLASDQKMSAVCSSPQLMAMTPRGANFDGRSNVFNGPEKKSNGDISAFFPGRGNGGDSCNGGDSGNAGVGNGIGPPIAFLAPQLQAEQHTKTQQQQQQQQQHPKEDLPRQNLSH